MILAGKTLYVDMVDIKPPGIFLILPDSRPYLAIPSL
jgi:hypothetical protein